MLSRRLIRVKVFKLLFSRVNSGIESIDAAERELITSCEKTRDLYFFILNSALSIRRVAEAKIEGGLKKHHPTSEEANPNRKFVENSFCTILENSPEFLKHCDTKGLNWSEYDLFIKKLFNAITTKEYYQTYMASPERSLKEDCILFENIFVEELEDNEALESIMEDINVYWMDDLDYVLNIIVRKLSAISLKSTINLPSLFIKEEDEEFAKKLLRNTLINYQEYMQMIAKCLPNWDPERLVITDNALIALGISEAISFSNIPIKVTINEYVELSKFYSTKNSKVFVNGLLDKILQGLVDDETVVKSGRGLL